MTAPARRASPALQTLFWLAVGGLTFYALFWLIGLVLRRVGDPIGPNADLFVEGARVTLLLTLVSGALGLVLGVVVGLARLSSFAPLRLLAGFYVWVLRGTPLLVQILFVYNALPQILGALGVNFLLNEFWSGVIALALNVGAYNAEVIRAGILAVPRGQGEASRSLGLSGVQTMTTIILPQALRLVVPPLVNNLVALLKDSSLVSAISLVELTLAGQRIGQQSFQPIPALTTIAAVYLLLTTVLTFFTDILERRLRPAGR